MIVHVAVSVCMGVVNREKSMNITVYGKTKEVCGLCESAKEKLKKLGFSFDVKEVTDYTEWHEGWRTDESVDVRACYSDINTLPVVGINGKMMGYPEAMKVLKELKRNAPAVQEPVAQGELVCA